jgi:hypothetical protein
MLEPTDLAYLVPRDRVVAIVKSLEGASLENQVVQWQTNCGTFALGVWAAACLSPAQAALVHPLLASPLEIGAAITWLMRIGYDLHGCMVKYAGTEGPQPGPGDLLRYNTPGTNNDHVEFLLGEMDGRGVAPHGGGGRANNAISIGVSDCRYSLGRPLVNFWRIGATLPPAKLVMSDAERNAANAAEAERLRLNALTASMPESPLADRPVLDPPEE